MNKIILAAILAAATFLSGCATPLGQQYGTAAALGGAIIGGAAGGGRGALIGGATGALVGGAIGDQQTYQQGGPQQRPYYEPQPQPQRRCWIERNVASYDGYGNFTGYVNRRVCR